MYPRINSQVGTKVEILSGLTELLDILKENKIRRNLKKGSIILPVTDRIWFCLKLQAGWRFHHNGPVNLSSLTDVHSCVSLTIWSLWWVVMNSVLPLLWYKQPLTQPESVTTATALSQPLSYSHCGQLGDCAHTWRTVIPIFQSLLLGENLNTMLARSLICNMPSFIELRDHHSWIQGRGLHLMLRGGWCFILYGSHFHTCLFAAELLFVQSALSQMLNAGITQSSRSLFCHDI